MKYKNPNNIYEMQNKVDRVVCRLLNANHDEICKCGISVKNSIHVWDINEWITNEGFGNKGYGKETMTKALQYCVDKYGKPESIQYTWNGKNEYVLEWLEQHFNAVCTCPIAVQKTQADDDWSSHIYELEVEKVFEYFGL